jgi:uncharacterized membrane protein (UPF0127 family)
VSELDPVEKREGSMPEKENVLLIFGGFPIVAPKQAGETTKIPEKVIGPHACKCTDGGACPVCGKNCHHEPSTMIEVVEEKKKKRGWIWLIIPLIFLLLLVPLAWLLPWDSRGPSPTPITPIGPPTKICFGVEFERACCDALLSNTFEESLRGLRFMQGLEPDGCMLYIMDPPDRYQFWSKDMSFPIDIILISPDKRVVEVHPNVPPCNDTTGKSCALFGGSVPISYAVEANGGYATTYGIDSGDSVRFEY